MILFALQVSPMDVREGIELAHLIRDIEPPGKANREWLVCYRRDTPIDRTWKIQRALAARFNTVHVVQGRRFANGWPAGPNALWLSTMEIAAELALSGKLKSVAVLTFEPDNVPARRDWMDRLESTYAHRQKPVIGNLHHDGIPDHINGNAIFPIDFLAQYPIMLETPPTVAWDFHNRELIMSVGQDTGYLTQLYKRKNLTLEEWRALKKFTIRPALVHGIKDNSARIFARLDLVPKNTLAPTRKLVLQP
jgi:hypothetical protein